MTEGTTALDVEAEQGRRPIAAGEWAEPLSGLRGLASVVVVVGHTFFATRLFPFTGVIHFLSIIVPLFFVVSAFWMYMPSSGIFKKGMYFVAAGILLTLLMLWV